MDVSALTRAVARAGRAPSAHNTQPWRVEAAGERVIVRVDRARHLAHGDPMERDLRLALGAFCEALRVGAAAEGLALEPAEGAGDRDVFQAFRVSGRVGVDAQARAAALSEAFEARVVSRLPYGPRMLTEAQRSELEALCEEHGVRMHLAGQGSRDAARWIDLLRASIRENWTDVRATAELGAWLRFRPRGDASPDGLDVRCMGLGRGDAAALLVAAQPGVWSALNAAFLGPVAAGALAEEELRLVRDAPHVCVLTTRTAERSATDPRSGAALLHFWSALGGMGLSVHPYSVLLDRRGWEVAAHLNVDTRQLVSFFRLGATASPPHRSGRRAIADVLAFRS